MGASKLSLSWQLVWARSTVRKKGTLLISTGGLKSVTMMCFEGERSCRTALASSRIRGGPCSGSNTILCSNRNISADKLCVYMNKCESVVGVVCLHVRARTLVCMCVCVIMLWSLYSGQFVAWLWLVYTLVRHCLNRQLDLCMPSGSFALVALECINPLSLHMP